MSILDDAIREHLELKRQHGADESELKRLEDEAFGPPSRPDTDPFAEAPTEFMVAPGAPAAVEEEGDGGRQRINVADLQEPPPPESKVPATEEEPSATEEEAVPEPASGEIEGGPATEERQAVAEQPTELFDVEAEIGAEGAPAAAEAPSPSDDELVEAEAEEPRLVPVADEDEEDEEFWSEQRLSDELDQALEAPVTDEDETAGPPAEPAADAFDQEEGEEDEDEDDSERRGSHEDVLEDTPDFLEDAPEDDELWFEQRPPKDFDFDD